MVNAKYEVTLDTKQCLDISKAIIDGSPPDDATYAELASTPDRLAMDILPGANAIRQHFFGSRVHLCCIVNGKSGKCAENCSFCAQSIHARTDASIYPLMDRKEIQKGVRYAADNHIHRFSVVTSGGRLSNKEVDQLSSAISGLPGKAVSYCASLGTLDNGALERLKQAGVSRYHHNLETAESHFGKICTTHAYADRVATIMAAKRAGMRVCAGGIFGIGETDAQVLELGMALRQLNVDSIPVNFLIPIPGTRMAGILPINPLRCLKIIALLRYLLFDREIIVSAGRFANLGEYHSMVFQAGASGIMTGDYLTTQGRTPSDDLAMIRDLGFIAKDRRLN